MGRSRCTRNTRFPGVSDNQGIALSRATLPGVMSAAKRDLDYLKSLLREAYEGV